MNPTTNNLADLQTNATNASNAVADTQAAAPGMLNQLKQNLVGIFAKDNPIIDARNSALTDYLSSANNTRASLLPSNTGDVPGIAGRPMTYSPTQQDAIVSSRNAAALAPLAGYNEILKGMYGNIGDIVGNAGNIYNSNIQANATRAGNLMDLYKQAVAQDQFNQQMALQKQQAAYAMRPMLDPSLIEALLSGGAQGQGQQLPDLSGFESPVQQVKPAVAAPKVNLSGALKSTNLSQPGFSSGGATGGNQLVSATPPNNGGNWALSPILDWIKGFQAPQMNVASLQSLGLQ